MTSLDASYWDKLWRDHETAWDIGYVSTPLKEYFDQLNSKNFSILMPGCGNSYEAEYLLQKGFRNVTVIDISRLLTQELEKKFKTHLGKEIEIITGNFFDLKGSFELVVEHTFFCTLRHFQRPHYVEKVYSLLKPGGKLAGVLFDREFGEGPPFGGSRAEYEKLFSGRFADLQLLPCYNSIPPRAGTELFMIARKK